jgi:hypothetical protein
LRLDYSAEEMVVVHLSLTTPLVLPTREVMIRAYAYLGPPMPWGLTNVLIPSIRKKNVNY